MLQELGQLEAKLAVQHMVSPPGVPHDTSKSVLLLSMVSPLHLAGEWLVPAGSRVWELPHYLFCNPRQLPCFCTCRNVSKFFAWLQDLHLSAMEQDPFEPPPEMPAVSQVGPLSKAGTTIMGLATQADENLCGRCMVSVSPCNSGVW